MSAYSPVRGSGRRTEVKAGDEIAMDGLGVRVIAASGSVLKAPLSGPGASNPFCADFTPHGTDITSRAADGGDSRSVSLFVTYGRFRTVIMGDLTWNKEFELMCPTNPLGDVDVYLVSHHGSDTSGSASLVHALRPRAAIMNNGPRKGGAIQTFQILGRLPGSVDLWQNHYSVPGGKEHNRPEAFIANLDEGAPLPGANTGRRPRSHRSGALGQGVCSSGRQFYYFEQPDRLHEAVSGKTIVGATAPRLQHNRKEPPPESHDRPGGALRSGGTASVGSDRVGDRKPVQVDRRVIDVACGNSPHARNTLFHCPQRCG